MPQLIGPGLAQLPSGQHLGRMALQDPASVVLEPAATANPTQPGEMVVQATSNTSLTFKLMGTDGVVRSGSIPLA